MFLQVPGRLFPIELQYVSHFVEVLCIYIYIFICLLRIFLRNVDSYFLDGRIIFTRSFLIGGYFMLFYKEATLLMN